MQYCTKFCFSIHPPLFIAVFCAIHYNDVIMSVMASQVTSLIIVYSTVYSGADQRKHESSMSLAFVRGIHWWPVNSPHKGPVKRKTFPFDDVIMYAILDCAIHRPGTFPLDSLSCRKCGCDCRFVNFKTKLGNWYLGYWCKQYPGPRLNIKTVLSTYGDFHVKDKTAVRTSYL